MDGLALLCNLHADGPLTLRRLRRAGIRKLGHIQLVPEETLIGILEASPAQVRRFVREARLLAERVYEGPEESSEGVAGVGFQRPGATPLHSELRTHPVFQEPAFHEGGEPERAAGAPANPYATPRHAAGSPPGSPSYGSPVDPYPYRAPARQTAPPTSPAPLPGVSPGGFGQAPGPSTWPGATQRAAGTLLRPGIVPGLDAGLVQRLIEQGVRTVEALVEETSLRLARRVGLPYTRLLDIQFQTRELLVEARRERGTAPLASKLIQPAPARDPARPTAPPASPRPMHSTGVPALTSEPPGVGGPFA